MATLLDIMGATAIGSFIIFMILQMNLRISDSAGETFLSALVQSEALNAAQIVQYDFYKIGYGDSGSTITKADTAEIKYLSDVDDNGSVDTVYYYEGSVSNKTNTPNPNDFPIYRSLNGGAAEIVTTVTNFSMTYYDSSGTEITAIQLANQTNRDKIKSIEVYLSFESAEPIDTVYQGIDWMRVIKPKNL